MPIVELCKEHHITFHASAESLVEGARLNDEYHSLINTQPTFIPKGVYFFKTHAEANKHQEECVTNGLMTLEEQSKNLK